MSLYLTKPIGIPVDKKDDNGYALKKLCRLLHVKNKDIKGFSLHKRSVDARDKSNVHFVCSYVADCAVCPQNAAAYVEPQNVFEHTPHVKNAQKCVVVGAGPAGLFAALYLVKCGMDVTVVERGMDVAERKQAVHAFFNGGSFNPSCNVQFGIGGAGAFSDGKLTSSLALTSFGRSVFKTLVECGAPDDILYEALPHVGTDNLEKTVASLRDKIISYGGRFLFETDVVDLDIRDGNVVGVLIKRNGATQEIEARHTVFACGHSSRDSFDMLYRRGAEMQFKPFAVGLRIEHSREAINVAQYGELFASHRDLSAASYKLTHTCSSGRGCYSFCMCPGGVVVAANSEADTVVVNGMSYHARTLENSNSAIVVTINAEDVARFGYGTDVFAGVRMQRDLERRAYAMGGGDYVAPCQNAADFLNNAVSSSFVVSPSYPRKVTSANLRDLLPKDIGDDLAEALALFDRKIRGFAAYGVLTGVETRTSSPVKIIRGADLQSNLKGLYPTGEGAGYAGGIVSAAVDGLKVAYSIVESAVK